MTRRGARPGFALLLALLLVVVVGIALAGLARWSMLGALEAQDAAEEVQRRWAIASCQATLLPRVDAVLEQADAARQNRRQAAPASAELRVNCRLSDLDFQLVFTDEQAKFNINRWLELTNPDKTQSALKQILADSSRGAGQSQAMLKLRPLVAGRESGGVMLPRLGSYGQLFDPVTPEQLLGTLPSPGLASAVTCWGDGRINIHRASESTIRQVCAGELSHSQWSALITLRNDDPALPLSDLLVRESSLNDRQRAALRDLFTDDSRCCGLWIVAQGAQRSWYALEIGEGGRRAPASDAPTAAGSAPREHQINQRYNFFW